MARFLLFLLLVLPLGASDQPRVANAKMQTRSAAAGLEKEFRALVAGQSEPAWIGYAAPMVAGRHQMCCSSGDSMGCCGACRLEGDTGVTLQTDTHGTVKLEGPALLFVLFRVEQKKVEKIRRFSEECDLDAGGLAFYWLADVRPAESIALLASFATAPEADTREGRRTSDGALSAIALHRDPEADRVLEQFVAPSQPEKLRERAAFWLGVTRGRRGYEVLRKMVQEDPSDRVRERAVFALTQSKEPEAVEAIIGVARSDKSPHVRGQALFWLAQKAGRKAVEAITKAIQDDPETEVKKRAVFALSRLPKEEGVPLLIQVARTNQNPAVRKQAMFWLGQSKDQRTLAFFEEILTR